MRKKPDILLVDDDKVLAALLAEFLAGEGFTVTTVHDGESALAFMQKNRAIDAIILDIMMPGISGIDVLQGLRSENTIPIIMLTGRGDDIDRIIGLELGADDYLAKPCNPRELAARIRAVLRRSQISKESNSLSASEVCMHNLRLIPAKRQLLAAGTLVSLTSAEFSVLQLLMQEAGTVVSKSELTEKVLHRKLSLYDRSIDVHVSRLRQKLQRYGVSGDIIKTIRGQGYLFVKDDV